MPILYLLLLCFFFNSYTFSDTPKHQLIVIGEALEPTAGTQEQNVYFKGDFFTNLSAKDSQLLAKTLLAQGFNDNNISVVLVSPTKESWQTAEILAKQGLFNKDKIKKSNLIIELQTFAGPPDTENYSLKMFHKESEDQVKNRIKELYNDILNKYSYGSVIVIAHVPIAQKLIDFVAQRTLKEKDLPVFTLKREEPGPGQIRPPKTAEETILAWAQEHLPKSGTLKESQDGFIYLQVDPGYIYQLFHYLSDKTYVQPPFFRHPDSPGAHISVFYADERRKTGPVAEVGQMYTFQLEKVTHIPQKKERYVVLQVKSPELEQLRKKYGLSPLLHNHPFHITIAEKKE